MNTEELFKGLTYFKWG